MANGSDSRRKVTYRAPIGSVDLKAFEDNAASYEIRACHDCLPWHTEAVIVDGEVLVRGWHAVGCPQFQDFIRD
ncbi:hypothetical protein ACIA7S_28930 [Streptomyces sp. NPDC051643]|uniref:hypothetical protein n=1 Tax=Streptomyces sp. NPDC051643 TaxID=3365665 RepID=UPI0037877F53